MKSENRILNSSSRPFEIAFRRKKRLAFLTTSLMLFCLFCFLASFSIRDFTTHATLDISANGEDTTAYVRRVVEREISDDELSNHVLAAAKNAGVVANADIATNNLTAIRDSFDVQIAKQKDQSKFRLTVLFHGKGGAGEQILTSRIAHDVAGKLDASHTTGDVANQFHDQYQLLQQQIERNSSARHSELTSARRMVEQINAGLSDIHNDLETFDPLAQINDQSDYLEESAFERSHIDQTIGGGAFQPTGNSAPVRVVNTSLPAHNSATASLISALNDLDTDSLQAAINQTQESLRSDAIQIREDVTTLNMLGSVLADNRLVVDSISRVKTVPSGNAPGLPHVLLFAILSALLGTVVAMAYKPECDGIGFETTDNAELSLGLPVIAQLDSEHDSGQSMPRNKKGFANHIVRYCEVGLFAFLMLIVVLCIVQVDIRTAFFENPFYGLARMASLFFGT